MYAIEQTAQCFAWIIIADLKPGKVYRLFVERHSQEVSMNKDQAKGRIKEAKGKAKKVTGKVIGDKSMETEGKVDEALGKVQRGYGDLKDDLEDELKKGE